MRISEDDIDLMTCLYLSKRKAEEEARKWPSVREIGKKFGLSGARVHQLIIENLKKRSMESAES